MFGHQSGQGFADGLRIVGLFGRHHQGHGTGAQYAGITFTLLAERDPKVRHVMQDAVGSDDATGGAHQGCLQTCPRRASMSSAALGPHVPAA